MKREGGNAKNTPKKSPKPEALQRNSPKRAQSRPGEITPRSLTFSRLTHLGEPNHAQTRSHLTQVQLG